MAHHNQGAPQSGTTSAKSQMRFIKDIAEKMQASQAIMKILYVAQDSFMSAQYSILQALLPSLCILPLWRVQLHVSHSFQFLLTNSPLHHQATHSCSVDLILREEISRNTNN